MITSSQIKIIIYDAAANGHLKPKWLVYQWLENLQTFDEEILNFVYNQGWNSAMDVVIPKEEK